MFGVLIYDLLFFAVPVGILVFFAISLCRYLSARKQEREIPGSVEAQDLKNRKALLIVSAVMAGVLLAVTIGLIVLLYMAVAFM
jgi:hypothetical protein